MTVIIRFYDGSSAVGLNGKKKFMTVPSHTSRILYFNVIIVYAIHTLKRGAHELLESVLFRDAESHLYDSESRTIIYYYHSARGN